MDGWFTSGVISFQSGTPETIHIGGYDKNGDGETYNDRPNWGQPKGTYQLQRRVHGLIPSASPVLLTNLLTGLSSTGTQTHLET